MPRQPVVRLDVSIPTAVGRWEYIDMLVTAPEGGLRQ